MMDKMNRQHDNQDGVRVAPGKRFRFRWGLLVLGIIIGVLLSAAISSYFHNRLADKIPSTNPDDYLQTAKPYVPPAGFQPVPVTRFVVDAEKYYYKYKIFIWVQPSTNYNGMSVTDWKKWVRLNVKGVIRVYDSDDELVKPATYYIFDESKNTVNANIKSVRSLKGNAGEIVSYYFHLRKGSHIIVPEVYTTEAGANAKLTILVGFRRFYFDK